MGKTTNFELNLAEGSQYVNPLTNDNPNYEKIDEVMKKNQDNSIQQATELVSGKVHAITCLVTDATFMRFTATGDFRAGDTFTYNGTPVTAFLPDGSGLSDYAYRINSEVLISVVGTRLTVYSYAAGSSTADNALALGGQPPEYYGKAADTISTYTQSKVEKVHNFVGNGANGKVKFAANVQSGDTIQVNGQTVSAFAGSEDFVTVAANLNLVGKTLLFVWDSAAQIITFQGISGSSGDSYVADWVDTGKKWVDGKPVYKRVMLGTFINGSYPPELSDVDTLISSIGYGKYGNLQGTKQEDVFWPLNYAASDGQKAALVKTATGCQFSCVYKSANASFVESYLIVEATRNI